MYGQPNYRLLGAVLVLALIVPRTTHAARTPSEAVAAMGAAATAGNETEFIAALDRRSGQALTNLARNGDAWQHAADILAQTLATKFGEPPPIAGVANGVPRHFVSVDTGERHDLRHSFLSRYLNKAVAFDVLRVEQTGSDARVYVRTTVRDAGPKPRVQEDVLTVHQRDGTWRVSLPSLSAMSDETMRLKQSRAAIVVVTRDLRAGRFGERHRALEARWQAEQLLHSTQSPYR
jgi:hypothetical protein